MKGLFVVASASVLCSLSLVPNFLLVFEKATGASEEKEEITDCVYKIPCRNCDKSYIGETGRKLQNALRNFEIARAQFANF